MVCIVLARQSHTHSEFHPPHHHLPDCTLDLLLKWHDSLGSLHGRKYLSVCTCPLLCPTPFLLFPSFVICMCVTCLHQCHSMRSLLWGVCAVVYGAHGSLVRQTTKGDLQTGSWKDDLQLSSCPNSEYRANTVPVRHWLSLSLCLCAPPYISLSSPLSSPCQNIKRRK